MTISDRRRVLHRAAAPAAATRGSVCPAVAESAEVGYGHVEADFCIALSRRSAGAGHPGWRGLFHGDHDRAAREAGNPLALTCIEPYPSDYLRRCGSDGTITLVSKKAQESSPHFFDAFDRRRALSIRRIRSRRQRRNYSSLRCLRCCRRGCSCISRTFYSRTTPPLADDGCAVPQRKHAAACVSDRQREVLDRRVAQHAALRAAAGAGRADSAISSATQRRGWPPTQRAHSLCDVLARDRVTRRDQRDACLLAIWS